MKFYSEYGNNFDWLNWWSYYLLVALILLVVMIIEIIDVAISSSEEYNNIRDVKYLSYKTMQYGNQSPLVSDDPKKNSEMNNNRMITAGVGIFAVVLFGYLSYNHVTNARKARWVESLLNKN